LFATSLALAATTASAQSETPDSLPGVADLFPDALNWQQIEAKDKTADTRYGTLSLATGEQCPQTREPIRYLDIRLNDRSIGVLGCTPGGDHYLNFFGNRFELGGTDVIVLSSDAGGSGSLPPRLQLIVLPPDAAPRIEADPEFRSTDGTRNVAAFGSSLLFDLGYVDGNRKTAVFDGETLRIEQSAVKPEPLADAHCASIYNIVNACIARGRGNDEDFSGYSPGDFLRLLSRAEARPIEKLLNDPGFAQAEFMGVCATAARTGMAPDYGTFTALVCTP
jgi:hypothetical protein